MRGHAGAAAKLWPVPLTAEIAIERPGMQPVGVRALRLDVGSGRALVLDDDDGLRTGARLSSALSLDNSDDTTRSAATACCAWT